jgi:predicted XRE-type DNA-binding protein
MIKYFFILIIILILISTFYDKKNIKHKVYNINNNNETKYNNINERFFDNISLKEKKLQIWSKIIDNNYFINIKPLTLKDYELWKSYKSDIVDNIYFNPNNHELVITTDNENNALIIAYSILLHFNGINNFEDSISQLEDNKINIDNNIELKNKLNTYIFNYLNNNNNSKMKMKSKFNIKTEHNNINEVSINSVNNINEVSINSVNNIDSIDAFNDNIDTFDNIDYSYI